MPAGCFHLVSTVCVHRGDGRVLLTRRAAGKDMALDWELPGGAVLSGESGISGAARELREETGLTVPPGALTWVGRHRENSPGLDRYEPCLVDLYTVSLSEVAPPGRVRPDPAEVADAEWVSLTELARRLAVGELAWPWRGRLHHLGPELFRRLGTPPSPG